MKTQLDDISYR